MSSKRKGIYVEPPMKFSSGSRNFERDIPVALRHEQPRKAVDVANRLLPSVDPRLNVYAEAALSAVLFVGVVVGGLLYLNTREMTAGLAAALAGLVIALRMGVALMRDRSETADEARLSTPTNRRENLSDRVELLTATNFPEVLLSILVVVGLLYGGWYLAGLLTGNSCALSGVNFFCGLDQFITCELLAVGTIWLFRHWRNKTGHRLLRE